MRRKNFRSSSMVFLINKLPLVFSLLFLLSYSCLNAATITSTSLGGLWNNTATWTGGVLPTSSDDVVIADGAVVTLDLANTVKSLTVGQGTSGVFQWGTTNTALTVSGDILINSGASLLLYSTTLATATINVGGNFTNNGFANLALGTLNFNGSSQSGGSLSQTLGGTGSFVGQGSSGIIRSLLFQTTGSSTISTSQNLIVTLNFTHTAGSLNTNGKLTLDNTAQVFGQAINTQVSSTVVTNMGSGYTTAPVVSANGAIQWPASTSVAVGAILVSGTNVYAVTTAGITAASAPIHTNGAATNGAATLLWVGNTGTIGNALIATAVLGTQYFYGNNLYTCITGGAINLAAPPIHTSSTAASGAATFLYVGPAAQVGVNYDATSQSLRSLSLLNPGSGYISAPAMSILNNGAGSGAAVTTIFFQQIAGTGNCTTTKSAIASISGGLTINSTQGATSFTGVGGISATNGGRNYTVAPQVGFAGPTAINLVTAGGSGFTSAPTITVTGGTLISGSALTTANFTITVAAGKIVSVYLNSGTTSCYSVPPGLSFSGGSGVGATLAFPAGCWPTATAVIGTNRQIANFVITNAGYGYVLTSPALSVGISGGTFGAAAGGLTCRIAAYNLNYTFAAPATSNAVFNEGTEIPASRRINSFTMNSSMGAVFTGNLDLFSSAASGIPDPITLTSGKMDFGSNTLTFSNPLYNGTSAANSSISGGIILSSIGGSQTKTFAFDRVVVVTTGTGSVASGSTITTLKISRTAAPSGSVSPASNYPTGTRTYRLQTSGGVYGTGPTVQLNYGAEDGLTSDNPGLLIAKATATSGPWTVVSLTSGSGALTVPGSRTTSSFTGTGDDYLGFTTTSGPCNSTPTAGSIAPVAGYCLGTTPTSVTITLSGYTVTSSGLTFAWEESTNNINFVPAVGSGTNTPVFTSPVILSTIYYRCVVTCSGGGSPAFSNSCKAGPVNCQYNVTRNTGITYNSIITPVATGSTYSTWSGGSAAGDDEYTNAISLSGTTFLYLGLPVSSFYSSTNGFLSFNTSLLNASATNNLASITNTQVLAPFWDDLVLRGSSSANHDVCMRYKINGTLGSGTADIIIEWADLERFNFPPPNINFQVVLHESDNSIDFNYGNFQLYDGSLNFATLFSYSIGLNGSTPNLSTLGDHMILLRENQNYFSTTNQVALSLTPECNSQFHFTPAAAYTGTDPGAPGVPTNDEKINAFTLPVNSAPCTALCGNIYTSLNATASSGITACSAVTPGTPDDDVWFKFNTNASPDYKIEVVPGINYDAVIQLLDASLNPILCVNNAGSGLTETMTATGLTNFGTTYYIRVYHASAGVGTSNGEFALCVSQLITTPTNDECAGATSLTVGSTCIATPSQLPATLAASPSAGIPVCSAGSPGTPDDDVWYSFTTASSPGLTYNISVTGSSTYNAVLQLFSGSCGALTPVGCVNATGNGGTELISTSSLSINTTYRIRIYHFGTGAGSGDFDVCVYVTPPDCPGGLSPVNGTAVSSASGTTLSWSTVSIATGYDVYLSTVQTDVLNEVVTARVSTNQPGLTYITGVLSLNTVYYWKVVARAATFRSIGCTVNNFNTSPPSCVVITYPINNSNVCFSNSFNLTWNASFGASGYDVYLNPGAGPATTIVSTNQAGTSYNIPLSSLPAGQYSWRVEPKNFVGTNSTCSNQTFTIVTPPTVSVIPSPPDASYCPGGSVTLSATGATNYTWTPAIGLNSITGSSVIASPSTSTVYFVSGEIVSGCASTASQAVVVNPVPTPPTTTSYNLCQNGSIPPGLGLTATCGGGNITNSFDIPLSNPVTNETTTCPGANLIASFPFPPIPAGTSLVSVGFTINGVSFIAGSQGSQIRLSFSGSGLSASSPCFQGVTTTTTPNPVDFVLGVPTAADLTTLKNLINPSGGTIEIRYNETLDNNTAIPDATFPTTGTFTYTITAPLSSPNWYDDPTNGTLLGSGSPFDPISSGALANSGTNGIYTYYARCASSFCQSTSTSANLIIGQPLVVTATHASTFAICGGLSDQLNASVTGGGVPYTYSWAPSTSLNNSTISNPVSTALSTTTYTVTATDNCNNSATATVTTTRTTAPSVAVTPTSASSCATSLGTFTLTATGGTSYSWSPAAGLNTTVGSSVSASPNVTTTYIVTGTGATGCTATATSTIGVGTPFTLSATASPTNVCINGSSQLNATGSSQTTVNSYTFNASTGATLNPMSGATTVISSGIDDTPTASPALIGFNFIFGGTTYSQYSVSPDGWILLGGATATSEFANVVTSATNVPKIYPFWDDLATGTTGNVMTLVSGSAPNRIFIVQWFVTIPRNTAGTPNSTFQAWLYEGSGKIEFRYGTMGVPSSGSISAGLTGSTSTLYNSISYASNTSSNSVANDLNTTAPASGTMYTFLPPSTGYTYVWSPSANLSNSTIANPLATGLTTSTIYTVTATNLVGGCTASATVSVSVNPLTSVAINSTPANPTICTGSSQTLSSTITGGGGPYTYSWAPSTGLNNTTGSSVQASPTSTTSYTLTVTDNCGTTLSSTPLTVTVIPLVSVSVLGSPSSFLICSSGSVNLTASGATTYAWTPSTGLNIAAGSLVTASPTSTTTYTVTGTSGTCSGTTTVTVTYSAISLTSSANNNPGCAPLSTQLNANPLNPTSTVKSYSFSAGTSTLNPMTGSTQVLASGNDDVPTAAPAAIGFSFPYEGVNYTSYSVSPDGWIKLGVNVASGEFTNVTTSTQNNPRIYPYWDDLATGTTGSVRTLLTGSAPNRIFIVQWFVVIPRNILNPANSTFQAWLYEGSGKVEFHYGAMGSGTMSASVGLTGQVATNFNSVTVASNTTSNVTANDANAGQPVNGTLYTFIPPATGFTYLWSPSSNLNSSTVSNPLVSGLNTSTGYTVTVTNGQGCSATSVINLIVNSSPTAPTITYPGYPSTASLTFCSGGSVLLNATGGPYSTYKWTGAGTTILASTTTYTATTNGTFTVTVSSANNCTSTSSIAVNVQSATTPVITYSGYPNTSALTFCQGGSLLLNAAGAYTSYSWTSGGTNPISTISTYSATVAGTYRVKVTAANGCTASSSVVVSTTPSPPAPVITAIGSHTLCDNGSTSITINASGTSGYILMWNNADESITPSLTVPGDDASFAVFGNPYAYHLTITNPATNCSSTSNDILLTQVTCGPGVTLNAKIMLQGSYVSGGLLRPCLYLNGISANPLDADSVAISAIDPVTKLYVDSGKKILKTNGNISIIFAGNVLAGNSYYIKINHRNTVETWSKDPVLFSPVTTYDFTTSMTQAYGDNMILTTDNLYWSFYSGDINQDQNIDLYDYSLLEYDNLNFIFGYIPTDLTGDGNSDLYDFTPLDLNNSNFIYSIHP